MKRLFVIFLSVVLFLSGCVSTGVASGGQALNGKVEEDINAFEINRVIDVFAGSSRIGYSTLREFLEPSYWSVDTVVIGEFVDETETWQEYQYREFFDKEVMVDAHANGRFQVSEVLWGDAEIGDVITIYQRYAYDFEHGELISFSELTPMHKGDRWIYFLRTMDDGRYFSAGDSDGRYPLPNHDIMQMMALFPDGSLDVYKVSNEEAWASYNDARNEIFEKYDSSVFGVINRNDFNFALYAELIDFFNIKASDWNNPYQRLDAKIISVFDGRQQ